MLQKSFLFLALLAFPFVATFATPSWSGEYCAMWMDQTGCESEWNIIQGKLDAALTPFHAQLDRKPIGFARRELAVYDETLLTLQNEYVGSPQEMILGYIIYQFRLWDAEYQIQQETISLPRITNAVGEINTVRMRQMITYELTKQGFDGFVSQPWVGDADDAIVTEGSTTGYRVTSALARRDVIDVFLNDMQRTGNSSDELTISPHIRKKRAGKVYLFKNTADLEALGYFVASHRVRTNYDEGYRRTNIATAFDEIGHVMVLNPGQEFSFLEDSNFDPSAQQLYKEGKVIFLDEEVDDYGGGLCGASTAIYQGIVTNQSLSRPALRNHSKRYSSLYTATIDGEKIATPGLDSTIYSWSLDLKLKNTATHPIVLVMNYDGTYGGVEEVFTLGRVGDQGSVQYVSQRPYQSTLQTKNGGSKKVTGKCYTWRINGEDRESCYKEVK